MAFSLARPYKCEKVSKLLKSRLFNSRRSYLSLSIFVALSSRRQIVESKNDVHLDVGLRSSDSRTPNTIGEHRFYAISHTCEVDRLVFYQPAAGIDNVRHFRTNR